MAKPILAIWVPDAAFNITEMINTFKKNIAKEIEDYHTLFFVTFETEAKIHVFYEKDITEIQIEELNQLVTNEIRELKNRIKDD